MELLAQEEVVAMADVDYYLALASVAVIKVVHRRVGDCQHSATAVVGKWVVVPVDLDLVIRHF